MQVFSQNDPRWKTNKIGFDTGPNDTIGNYGCYMTAIANVCSWAGTDYDPNHINDLCKVNSQDTDSPWLVSSDLVARDDIPALLCPNLQYVGKTTWNDVTSMNFFEDASDPNVAYIIKIDAAPNVPGVQSHFVMVWAMLGASDLEINDSWDGVRKPLSQYGNPGVIIQSATKFMKVPETAPAIVTPIAAPEPTPAPEPPAPTPYIPPAAPLKGTLATKYTVLTTIMQFATSQDAIFHKNPTTIVNPGDYYQFATQDSAVQLGKDNMNAQFWINTKDNVAPIPDVPVETDPAVNPVATADWKSTFSSFPDGKSRRYVAQRDMFLYDLAASKADGINIKRGDPVPIYGSVQKGGMTYLIPRLQADTVEGQIAPKEHWYGIPTTSVYTGLPNTRSQQYIDALAKAEAENRIYRKSKGHETTSDKVYYAEQLVARFVKDGGRFVDGIISGATIKKIKAVIKGQKEQK